MLPKLEEITREYIEQLLTEKRAENSFIEYRERFPAEGEMNDETIELLRDISAFANSSGGMIYFGVAESRDALGKPTGVPDAVIGLDENLDSESAFRRLKELVMRHVAPRVHGLKLKTIDGFPQGKVFALRVPQSYYTPHMITLQPVFFTRRNSGNEGLDFTQIREAFINTEDLQDRVKNFRMECVEKVQSRKTPMRMYPFPRLIMQIFPLSAFRSSRDFDINCVVKDPSLLPPLGAEKWEGRPNYDGFFTYSMVDEICCDGYTQLHRNGCVETVSSKPFDPASKDKTFPPFDEQIFVSLNTYLRLLKTIDVPSPLFIMVSLLGIQGYRMKTKTPLPEGEGHPFKKNEMLLPELLVHSYPENLQEIQDLLQGSLDAIWQASGMVRKS